MKIELSTNTTAVLIAGLYCTYNDIDGIAIPESVFLSIAEKLEFFASDWNYDVISFEDWIKNCLLIIPKVLLTEEDIQDMQSSTLYWEYPNGNMILVISMDIRPINEG